MSEQPIASQMQPYPTELEEGKTYYWCACGRSKKQPFCDGSHKVLGLSPIKFTAEETGTAYLCGCRKSQNKPFCDGSHNKG